MAVDRAVDSAALNYGLTKIADTIREKAGTSDTLEFPNEMAEAIAAISAGGYKIEGCSFTPASTVSGEIYEICETKIQTPHFCVCFTNTTLGNNANDNSTYMRLMFYVGGDSTFFGNIWSAYNNGKKGAVVYIGDTSSTSYKVAAYGSSIAFNNSGTNGFYVSDGKLYCRDDKNSTTTWKLIAGKTYHVLLIGE